MLKKRLNADIPAFPILKSELVFATCFRSLGTANTYSYSITTQTVHEYKHKWWTVSPEKGQAERQSSEPHSVIAPPSHQHSLFHY